MAEAPDTSQDQEDAEGEVDSFRKGLGPFVVAAETTRMPMVFTNARKTANPIVFANDAFLSLTGYERDEVLGCSFKSLMARGVDSMALEKVEAAFEKPSEDDLVIRYRRQDDSEFWADVFVSPVRSECGEVVQHFVSFVDLTKHKRDQAHCMALVEELNHRVKNTLATVQSIAFQAVRRSSDPEAVRASIESRLLALSRSHDLLTRERWEGAGLRDLVVATLEPFGVTGGRSERVVISGENVRLTAKATLALGIAIHELATNAVKYGAFSNEKGSVAVSWTTELASPDKRLIIRWQESNGPSVLPPSRKGFGSQVIGRGLAHELEGVVELEYFPHGVSCTIDLPAPNAARDA